MKKVIRFLAGLMCAVGCLMVFQGWLWTESQHEIDGLILIVASLPWMIPILVEKSLADLNKQIDKEPQ